MCRGDRDNRLLPISTPLTRNRKIACRQFESDTLNRQLADKTGFSIHWFLRWEYDPCIPSQVEWNVIRKKPAE